MNHIDLLSPNHVMARLDIPPTTLYRWIQQGHFPKPVKIGPRRTAFRISDIERWIKKQDSQNSQPEPSAK